MCDLKIFQEPGFGGSGTAFSPCADLPSLSDAPVMGSVKSAPKSTAVMGAFCSTQYRQPASTSRSFDIASQIHQYLSCAHFGTFPFGCEGSTGTSTSMSSDYRQSVACWRSRDRCSASDVFTWKGIYVRSLRRAPTLHACSDAIELSQFFCFLLQEIGFGQDEPTPVFVDNRSAVFTGSQSSLRIRGQEHIVRLTHFIAEAVQFQEVTLNHVPTIDNIADILTKSLPAHRISTLRARIGMIDVSTASAG